MRAWEAIVRRYPEDTLQYQYEQLRKSWLECIEAFCKESGITRFLDWLERKLSK